MSSSRLAEGGLIDRSRTLSFTFDGRTYSGHPGDTLASALLANGVSVMGRSFKYHRPRGVWGAWFDDPNAIFNVSLNGDELPNCPATTTALVDGMQARAVNAFPSAAFDIKSGLDLFSRFLSAGFYYKTFMWPDWHLFEPMIRKMAGLGALDGLVIEGYQSDQLHETCETLVVGGGAAGLIAARAAAEAGQSVILVDDHPIAGGGIYRRGQAINGQAPGDWAQAQIAAIEVAGGRILQNTTAIGVYDHQLVGLAEDRGFGLAPRLLRVRAGRTIMATGALDRPLTFANNDRPGVMSVDGALEFLGRYGVLVGRKIAIASNNSFGPMAADTLRAAGADVQMIDPQTGPMQAFGGKTLRGVRVGADKVACDTLLASGGLTPIVHLWRHAGGKLNWREDISAFVPSLAPDGMVAVGAANGTFDFDAALDEAHKVATGGTFENTNTYHVVPHWPKPGSGGRQWIDFQHDVTLKDVELAARENYVSVEHLKRYTTLGMASDQGKTSNMAGLAAMAAIQNRPIPEVGTTTFRPPFVPVPLELYHGSHRGQLFHPLKRLALENEHRVAGAALGEYGGWLRPSWYGNKPMDEAVKDEVLMTRKVAGIMDASPLGKIEVMGPDAESFVNFIYNNTIKTLKTGRIRYGFMLTESGVVYDDGVIARLDDNHFLISCSSSHVDSVNDMLERWRQDGNDPDRIFVHNVSSNWPTVTIAGPKARDILASLDTGLDLSPENFLHMSFQDGQFDGAAARVARVSFTGELSYEVSVPVDRVTELWNRTLAAAKLFGAGPVGLEASLILRAEKGYIIIGKDTDGETMPHDLGFGVPRQKKTAAFVGDRGLHTDIANDEDRRQLIGLRVSQGTAPIPTGAHLVSSINNPKSIGIVTSSYHSPTVGQPIALALIERGAEILGQSVTVWHMGQSRTATVTSPCFIDPEGKRLHA